MYDHNVTRSVYTDSLIHTMFWQKLYENKGEAGVEEEAVRSLQALMPDVTIPKPLKTIYYYTPGIHANQKAGSYRKGLTNEHILEWASKKPLADTPQCKLVLATDSFNPRMVGWAQAGWVLIADWFKHCEGIEIDSQIDYCKPYTGAPLFRTWCDCRPGSAIPPEGLAYIAQNCPRPTSGRQEQPETVPSWAVFKPLEN